MFHPKITDMIGSLPQNKRISLLTNGTLLNYNMSRHLITAGLNELWISIDAFEKREYEQVQYGASFDKILSNLNVFNDARAGTKVKLGLTFVVTGANVDQLAKINDFADRFGVDELNVSLMIPQAAATEEYLMYKNKRVTTGRMLRYKSTAETNEEYVCPFIASSSVFVRVDGCIAPCMQLLHSCHTYLFEEKRDIQSFTYGNIKEKTLIDCWNSEDYSNFRRRVDTFYFPFCRVCWGCEDRKKNLSDCILNDAPTCGACLWASGKVFCP